MNKTKMNILVINEGYSNNLGDQAINKSFAHIIKNIYKNNYFFEDLNRKKIDNDYKNLNINFKKPSLIISWIYRFYWFLLNFKRINRSLIKIDYVLIGGGQLLMPNNIFPYVIFIWTLLIRLKKIPYSFFSVGSQGNYDLIDRFFLNKSLQKAENIYVRDNLTQSILKKTFNVNSLLTYDVAFFFNKIVKSEIKTKNMLLIGPISFEIYKKYSNNFNSRIEYFEYWFNMIKNSDYRLVNLFYSTNEDRVECLDFRKYIMEKYSIKINILENRSLDTFVNNIKSSEKIISGRMHSLILAKTFGIKYKVFHSSDKLKEFEKIYKNIDLNFIQSKIKTDLNNIFQN